MSFRIVRTAIVPSRLLFYQPLMLTTQVLVSSLGLVFYESGSYLPHATSRNYVLQYVLLLFYNSRFGVILARGATHDVTPRGRIKHLHS